MKEKYKTMHNVFDEFTNRNLYKLINEGHFKGLVGQLTLGKESNIFIAEKDDGQKVIVKIYRLHNCDFNKMYDYIKYDPRYVNLKKKRREVIFAWTQREFRNLMLARDAGIKVPTPYTFKFNILVEEFIGDESAAQRIKEQFPENPKEFFEDTVNSIIKLGKAGLIHADLSSFNILNYHEKPCFIDFSQATALNNPNDDDYLERDIRNLCNFFKKRKFDVDESKVLNKIRIQIKK